LTETAVSEADIIHGALSMACEGAGSHCGMHLEALGQIDLHLRLRGSGRELLGPDIDPARDIAARFNRSAGAGALGRGVARGSRRHTRGSTADGQPIQAQFALHGIEWIEAVAADAAHRRERGGDLRNLQRRELGWINTEQQLREDLILRLLRAAAQRDDRRVGVAADIERGGRAAGGRGRGEIQRWIDLLLDPGAVEAQPATAEGQRRAGEIDGAGTQIESTRDDGIIAGTGDVQ